MPLNSRKVTRGHSENPVLRCNREKVFRNTSRPLRSGYERDSIVPPGECDVAQRLWRVVRLAESPNFIDRENNIPRKADDPAYSVEFIPATNSPVHARAIHKTKTTSAKPAEIFAKSIKTADLNKTG